MVAKIRKMLFVSYGGGHVNMILPILQKLMGDPNISVDVMALTTARSVLELAGIPCFSFRDLPIDKRALDYGCLLVGEGSGHVKVPIEESIAYMGLSYQCLVDDVGETKAKETYALKGRHAFLPVAILKGVIGRGGYDLVVATNSPRAEQAAILAAGELGIPSICIVDLFATQGVKWLGKEGYASKVCVLTESVKKRLCDAGRSNDEIVVTGNPAFDYLAAPEIKQQGEELRRSKGWDDKKVILWCSQPEPQVHPFTGIEGDSSVPARIEYELKKICDKLREENWCLCVRPHPSEDLGTRVKYEGVEYNSDKKLPALLSAADVVVVMTSTVGLEAALLGRPVISLNMSIFTPDMPYAKMGIAAGVDALQDLDKVLRNMLNCNEFSPWGLPAVGGATKRVIEVMNDLLAV